VKAAKVLVAGAGEAGKSTLIRALVPDAMNLAVRGRTIAMDHAVLLGDGCRLSIVGVPGQERFGAVRAVLAEGARGVVWVHRAGCSPDTETASLVRGLTTDHVPYLVVINHVNGDCRPHGWSRSAGLPSPTKIIECDLQNPGEVSSLLREEIQNLLESPATCWERNPTDANSI